jgi:hypothetical protein
MVNFAGRLGLPQRTMAAREQVGAALDTSLRCRAAMRLSFYWLLAVAVLAVGNMALSVWFAAGTATTAAQYGVRFNLLTFAIALALSLGIGICRPRWWRMAVVCLALGPVPILLVTSGNVSTAAATLLLVACLSWLGRQLVARILGDLDLVTAWAVGATLGVCLLAAFGFVAGILGLLRPHTTWTLLIIIAAGLIVAARAQLQREVLAAVSWLGQPAARSPLHCILAGAALACLWLNLLGALAPETRSDAIRQRLVVAAQFAHNGNLDTPDPDLVVANDPALGEIAYAFAITIGSVQAANLLHFMIGLLCTLVVFALGSTLGDRFAGGLAATAFYSTLMTSWLSQSAYLDLITTLLALTSALLLVMHPQRAWRSVALAGICAGLGVAVKLHFGYIAVGLGLTAGLLALRTDGMRRAVQLGAIMTGSAMLAAAPWIARSIAITGRIPGVTIFDLKTFGIGRSLWDLLVLPFTATLLGDRFGGEHFSRGLLGGHFGYLLLGLLPTFYFLRNDRRAVALLAGAAASTVLWFYTAQYLRYGLPIIALLMAVAGAAYVRLRQQADKESQRRLGNIVLCLLILSGVFIRLQLPDIAHRYALGLQSRESFLNEQIDELKVLNLLDSQPGATRLLAVWDGPRLYSTIGIGSPFRSATQFAAEGPDREIFQRLRDGGYSHIMLDRRAASIPAVGWDRLTITNEDFLRRYTALVAGDQYVYLYRVLSPAEVESATPWAQGRELLPNGGFEQQQADQPAHWSLSGDPRYDRTGGASRTGAGAVLLGPGDRLGTTATVQAGSSYLLAGANRGIDAVGIIEFQIEWRDEQGRVVATGGEKMISSPRGYRAYSILASAPEHATTATISVRAINGQAWIDDLSLRAVAPDAANTDQPTKPLLAR